MQHLPAIVVVLATLTGLALWGWTVAACQRDAAGEKVTSLERLLRARSRSVRALADLLAGR